MRVDGSLDCYVTRYQGEENRQECIRAKLLGGIGSVMVWGAIWYGGRSELIRFDTSESEGKKGDVTTKIYRDQITKRELKRSWKVVKDAWRGYGHPSILEDNVRIHTSPVNRLVGRKQGFQYVNHPPSSPDLNPIENCWSLLKTMIGDLPRRPTTPDTLFQVASRLWHEIPQEKIDNMIDSMERRLKTVRSGHGWPTKY